MTLQSESTRTPSREQVRRLIPDLQPHMKILGNKTSTSERMKFSAADLFRILKILNERKSDLRRAALSLSHEHTLSLCVIAQIRRLTLRFSDESNQRWTLF